MMWMKTLILVVLTVAAIQAEAQAVCSPQIVATPQGSVTVVCGS